MLSQKRVVCTKLDIYISGSIPLWWSISP